MKTQKTIGLFALGAPSILLIGGIVTAYLGNNSFGKTPKWNMMNMTGMRGGPGRMHLSGNGTGPMRIPENGTFLRGPQMFGSKMLSDLGLPTNATASEIRDAMDKKMQATQVAIDSAIQSGDYAAWKALMENDTRGKQLTTIITSENFLKYVDMYQAQKKAQELGKELGLGGANGMGCGGKGFPMAGKGRKPPVGI